MSAPASASTPSCQAAVKPKTPAKSSPRDCKDKWLADLEKAFDIIREGVTSPSQGHGSINPKIIVAYVQNIAARIQKPQDLYPELKCPSFDLCGECMNLGKCQLQDGKLTNIVKKTEKTENAHEHADSQKFPRLKKYFGTFGTLSFTKGSSYWEVEASFDGKGGGKQIIMEMGVVNPYEQDEYELLLRQSRNAWGVQVVKRETQDYVGIRGWEGGRQVCHTKLMPLSPPKDSKKIRLGFLLNVEDGTIECRDAAGGTFQCILRNLSPRLIPFFGVRPQGGDCKYNITLEVLTGEKVDASVKTLKEEEKDLKEEHQEEVEGNSESGAEGNSESGAEEAEGNSESGAESDNKSEEEEEE